LDRTAGACGSDGSFLNEAARVALERHKIAKQDHARPRTARGSNVQVHGPDWRRELQSALILRHTLIETACATAPNATLSDG
jgi:hypothetical protein